MLFTQTNISANNSAWRPLSRLVSVLHTASNPGKGGRHCDRQRSCVPWRRPRAVVPLFVRRTRARYMNIDFLAANLEGNAVCATGQGCPLEHLAPCREGGSGEQRGKTESNSKDPARKQRYYPPRSCVRSIFLPQTRREECFEPTCNRGQICSTAREGNLAKGDTNAKLQGMCALVGVVLARKSIEHSGSVARRDLYVVEATLQRAQASTVVAIFY